MPFKCQTTIGEPYLCVNGQALFKITEIEDFNDETVSSDSKINLFRFDEPITMQARFNPCSFKRARNALLGWKAKGPYRKRTLDKLIFWRYVK